jgi:hypothetical protein
MDPAAGAKSQTKTIAHTAVVRRRRAIKMVARSIMRERIRLVPDNVKVNGLFASPK